VPLFGHYAALRTHPPLPRYDTCFRRQSTHLRPALPQLLLLKGRVGGQRNVLGLRTFWRRRRELFL
jgi:hypothetical protein